MILSTWIGKISGIVLRTFRHTGGTWPGHIVLHISPYYLNKVFLSLRHKPIIVSGTNGKTTTTALIAHVLRQEGYDVITNSSGANLHNGVVSTLVKHVSWRGQLPKESIVILEVDENALPQILKEVEPHSLVLLNLFRDQLDRYGEIDSIRNKWRKALSSLSSSSVLILNADDPGVASLASKSDTTFFFGLNQQGSETEHEYHVRDSDRCPECGSKLTYSHYYFSHLGVWKCTACDLTSPDVDQTSTPDQSPLLGRYNDYNVAAARLVLSQFGISEKSQDNAWQSFSPAFGRGEELTFKQRNIHLFLAKNPTGFNEALRTALQIEGRSSTIALFLNDRIPDGRDVSWIWDIDLESSVSNWESVVVGGDRMAELGVRVQYAGHSNIITSSSFLDALEKAAETIPEGETLPVLATYSAMLEIRNIILGRKIL